MLNRLKYGPVAGRFTMRRRTSFLLSILPMTSIWMRSDPSLPNDRRPWSRDQHPHNIWEALEWRNEDLPFIYSIGSWLLVLSLSMNWRADPPTWVFFQSGVGCRGKGILYMYMCNLFYNRSPLISYSHVKLTYISLDHLLVSQSNLITHCVFKLQCTGNDSRFKE